MPYQYQFHTDKNYLSVEISGELDFSLFIKVTSEIMADPQYKLPLNILWNISGVKITDMNVSDTLHAVAAFEKKYLSEVQQRLKIAIIAPEDLLFGFARMLEAFSDTLPVIHQVFRKYSDAVKWIEKPVIY